MLIVDKNCLRDLLYNCEVTQKELAEMIGVHHNTVGRWVRDPNTVPLGRLVQIIDAVDEARMCCSDNFLRWVLTDG